VSTEKYYIDSVFHGYDTFFISAVPLVEQRIPTFFIGGVPLVERTMNSNTTWGLFLERMVFVSRGQPKTGYN
jgi:hypothetical protein